MKTLILSQMHNFNSFIRADIRLSVCLFDAPKGYAYSYEQQKEVKLNKND